MARPPTTHAVKLRRVLCLCCEIAPVVVDVVAAQVIGNEAEMDRLREKAEEAMANDDPEGTAMNMGRTALIAKLLAMTHHADVSAVCLFQGPETLFRAQEHSYHAMALFRMAGGQLPASSGICESLSFAHSSDHQRVSSLGHEDTTPSPLAMKAIQLREAATD
jgi:hypothetical protein